MITPVTKTVLTPRLIYNRTVNNRPNCNYLVRLSKKPDLTRVLVVVHGISRRATLMLRCLSPLADDLNYTLLAPVFNHRAYPDYQRLGRKGRGERADLAFLSMLRDAQSLIGIAKDIHMFGYSGGAQFVHRFAYAYPNALKSVTIAAAGWYTAPSPDLRFPYGIKSTKRLPDVNFNAKGLALTPSLILVGENDTVRGVAVRQSSRVNEQQGSNRLIRAKWFQRQIMEMSPLDNRVDHQFCILPNTAHDFAEAVTQGGLDHRLFEFCEKH